MQQRASWFATKLILLVWITTVTLVGCSFYRPDNQSTSPYSIVTSTVMPSLPKSTDLSATPTLDNYSPTATMPLLSFPSEQCIDISPNLPRDVETEGVIILYGKETFLLDPKSGVKKVLQGMQADFLVSPDHKWVISTFKDSQDKLWLLTKTASGEEQKPIPWDQDNWFEIGGWLDNERVWVSHYTGPTVTIVNPFTGERQELVGKFPGIETVEDIDRYPLGVSSVVYNSHLNLAIYPSLEADTSYYLVLWDIQAEQVLAKIKHISVSPPNKPIWSLDEKKVYVIESQLETESDNIFSLSRDGHVHQLTHFGNISSSAKMFGLSLSPDGKNIAFWLGIGPSSDSKNSLAVLNIETDQVTNYCITGPTEYGGLSYPVWSPNSRYLAIAHWDETASPWTVLVDTWQGWAANLAQDVTPEGWILSAPSP